MNNNIRISMVNPALKKLEKWNVWSPGKEISPCFVFDKKEGSVCMSGGNKKGVFGYLRQVIFGVKPGENHKFSISFKTKNIRDLKHNLVICLEWLGKDGNKLGMDFITEIKGKGKWKRFEGVVLSREKSVNVEIRFGLRWAKNGKVWWKDPEFLRLGLSGVPERKVKIGTVYLWPKKSTLKKNLELFCGLIEKAGKKKCDIVCLPETFIDLGVRINKKYKQDPEKFPNFITRKIGSIAKKYKMYVITSLNEKYKGLTYNTGILFDRNGKIAGKYRKVHLPNTEKEAGVMPGDSYPVFKTDFGKIGIHICWDYCFPEVARILALKGAEIVFLPIRGDIRDNTRDITRGKTWYTIAKARAIDNGVYFVASINHGRSLIIDPVGKILADSNGKNGVFSAEIDLSKPVYCRWPGAPGNGDFNKVFKKDRRQETYGELVSLQ